MAEGSAAFDGFLAKYTGDLTSSQFMEVWDHFDKDGNGFIEGTELDDFFRELARQKGGKQPSDQEISDMREAIMLKFDDNKDGRISMNEMSSILPMEESFLLLFRQEIGTSVEFMEIWRKYDADCSGYIESEELRSFLTDLLSKAGKDVTEDKLAEYVETILKVFDTNEDGKLDLKEMSKLLPVKENFLTQFQIVSMLLWEELFTCLSQIYTDANYIIYPLLMASNLHASCCRCLSLVVNSCLAML
ncbi:calretinin-like isoform X2 [Branchiostoma lanceolatum]|uniref:calretinin-like isoform X2 n=1 Tax=Branchiostoma lanceolatum TaxID=7740 RepID=UPI003451564E